MSATVDQNVLNLTKVLKSHDWRKPSQPVYGETHGQKTPKGDFRRPIAGASPLRSASSIGFATETAYDVDSDDNRRHRNVQSAAGIMNYVAIKTSDTIPRSSKHDACAIMDLALPPGKQQLRPGSDTFAIDIILRDLDLHRILDQHDQNDDFPFALLRDIRTSDRFKPIKRFPESQCNQEEEVEGVSSPKALGPAAQAILCDQAVLSVNGIKGHTTHKAVSGAAKEAEFSSIVEKLRRAGRDHQIRREAGIHVSVEDTPQLLRKISHVKERSSDSTDSGVVVNPATYKANALHRNPSSTSLNPAAAEFIAKPAQFIDPAIVEQSCNGRVERVAEVACVQKSVDKQLAIAQAFNDIANYSRNSLDNLHEVVQNTIQKYGIPGLDPPCMPGPAPYPGNLPCGSFPPTPPVGIDAPFHSAIPMAPPPGLGLPPPQGTSIFPPPQAPLGFATTPQYMGLHGPLPHLPLPRQMGPFATPDFAGHPPPYPAPGFPPGFGFHPGPLLPTSNMMMPKHGVPGQHMPPLSPPKPRVPDAMSQQQYEAHIEWRKANEPGYALKCKERQTRRNLHSNRSSMSFSSTTPTSESGDTW